MSITAIKIISGAYQPDVGTIRVDGRPVTFHNPRHAMALGIATVYQNLALVDQHDVMANIFLGQKLVRGLVLDRCRMLEESAQVLQRLRTDIPIAAVVIGGTPLFGGAGSILGTLLGADVTGMIINSLVLLGVSAYFEPVAEGCSLLRCCAMLGQELS